MRQKYFVYSGRRAFRYCCSRVCKVRKRGRGERAGERACKKVRALCTSARSVRLERKFNKNVMRKHRSGFVVRVCGVRACVCSCREHLLQLVV